MMNDLDKLNDLLGTEMMSQKLYNKYMLQVAMPEARQLFTQLRDGKMQQVTQLQLEIKNRMG